MSNPNSRNDRELTILGHLAALRDSLFFAFAAWLACAIAAGIFAPRIFAFITAPAKEIEGLLQGLDLTSGFSVAMDIAIWGGTALAFPFIVYAILRFIFPALTKREKTILLAVLAAGSFLFLAGVSLAYAKTLPLVVKAFSGINSWVGLSVQTVRIEGYISIALKTIIAFGFVFQMPLVLFVLGLFGIVSSAALREKRRLAIVVSFALSMFLTPPDPMSQIIMAVPLCLLYEASIWALWLKERA